MSLGKAGQDVMWYVTRITLQQSVWLIMNRVRAVRGISVVFSLRIFCATVLCFGFLQDLFMELVESVLW